MINIDLVENKEADFNALVSGSGPLAEQGKSVDASLTSYLASEQVSGIFCVAGGWAGGNAGSKGTFIAKG